MLPLASLGSLLDIELGDTNKLGLKDSVRVAALKNQLDEAARHPSGAPRIGS